MRWQIKNRDPRVNVFVFVFQTEAGFSYFSLQDDCANAMSIVLMENIYILMARPSVRI